MNLSIKQARLEMILAMTIFGTIGIIRKYIELPSEVLALFRGIIGTGFLFLIVLLRKDKLSKEAIKSNLGWLVISGVLIGANWILLFEAYQYTTVATATLCYYLAPVFVTIASPFVLKEKMTIRKLLCVLVALFGMVLVSGILNQEGAGQGQKGILFGIGAAFLYAVVILMNQKLHDIRAYDKTILQLGAAAVALLPYVIFAGKLSNLNFSWKTIFLVIIAGILHTGIAYALYFGSMSGLNAQTVAIFSYIDPVVAIILSALVLRESMGADGVIGALLILGSTLFSEISLKNYPRRKRNESLSDH